MLVLMDWLLGLFPYFSSCSCIAATPYIMSFFPPIYFLHSFLFYSLNPFPFSCSFCFLTCSQLPLSLLLLSSISVRHVSFNTAPDADTTPAWAEWPRGAKWAWRSALQRATGSSSRGWDCARVRARVRACAGERCKRGTFSSYSF